MAFNSPVVANDWKRVEAFARRKDWQVSPSDLARRFGIHRATISSHFLRKGIQLDVNRSRRIVKIEVIYAIALFFFGFNREQIEKLLGIKSETLTKHLLRLAPLRIGQFGRVRQFNHTVIAKLIKIWTKKRLDLEWVKGIDFMTGEQLPESKRQAIKAMADAIERWFAPELLQQLKQIPGIEAELVGVGLRVSSTRGAIIFKNVHR